MSQILYNGIVLPETWPPPNILEDREAEIPVPYLETPPAIIPIDTGRQLFVDDFLIESTTLERVFSKPAIHHASPVLTAETEEEMDNGNCPMAAPFNDGICFDPHDGLFKLWYMPGFFHSTALATSPDGIHWERPDFGVVPGTNLVWPNHDGFARDGCLVWLDHHAMDAAQRFKMFQYYRRDHPVEGTVDEPSLHTSPDGIHWSDPIFTIPVGDNTSFFYNPFRRKWCMSVRRSSEPMGGLRARWYHEREDFIEGAQWDPVAGEVFWQRTDGYDLPDPARPDHPVSLYDLNVTPYESLMLGMFAIFRGPENEICVQEGVPKTIDLELGYSRDGFHFSRPDRTPFLASSRQIGDWNRAYLHAAGGLCVVVGDELYFYFGAFSGESPRLGPRDQGAPGRKRLVMYAGASTGLATLRRDGFASMTAGHSGGVLTTRPLSFTGSHLYVNVDAAAGELRTEILDLEGNVIDGFGAATCLPISGNAIKERVTWSTARDLSRVSGKPPVRFRFHLFAGRLYSFWVSKEASGASGGYVAAGGPSFLNGRDG